MTDDVAKIIRSAFYDAHSLRPYVQDAEVIRGIQPNGGDWRCMIPSGAITRSIVWNDREVALVNPRGDLGDDTECQIAMAMRALPLMDAALRAIMVLVDAPTDRSEIIRKIAESAIAYVEMPGPQIVNPEDDYERDMDEDLQSFMDRDRE